MLPYYLEVPPRKWVDLERTMETSGRLASAQALEADLAEDIAIDCFVGRESGAPVDGHYRIDGAEVRACPARFPAPNDRRPA